MSKLMPAIFFGHGNPMNALYRNSYTQAWAAIGKSIPRPQAVLAVSAHWYVPYCPVPGSPELASSVKDMLAPSSILLDEGWGLDHGTWSVLKHVFPAADIPIVQLSIDESRPPSFHYDLGKRLASLREGGN